MNRIEKQLVGSTATALAIAIFVAILSLTPFMLMVLLGALGHAFHEPHLFVSFWQSVLLVFLLTFIGSFFGSRSK